MLRFSFPLVIELAIVGAALTAKCAMSAAPPTASSLGRGKARRLLEPQHRVHWRGDTCKFIDQRRDARLRRKALRLRSGRAGGTSATARATAKAKGARLDGEAAATEANATPTTRQDAGLPGTNHRDAKCAKGRRHISIGNYNNHKDLGDWLGAVLPEDTAFIIFCYARNILSRGGV